MARSRSRSKNNANTKYILASLVVLALLFVVVAKTGGFSGYATAKNVGLSITIGNQLPYIYKVSPVSAQNPTEAGTTAIIFTMLVTDPDGTSNLATISSLFNKTGETSRFNSSCSQTSILNASTANYTCTIYMHYFDAPGSWTINATATDINGGSGENSSTTFTYNQLVAIMMSPDNLTWASLDTADRNSTATNDPTLINNTGNANNNVSVKAFDLQGLSVAYHKLNAENFTVDIDTGATCSGAACLECDGTAMANGTSNLIGGATLPRGNYSVNDGSTGQEQLYYCLVDINDSISSQSYSTYLLGPWIVSASAI